MAARVDCLCPGPRCHNQSPLTVGRRCLYDSHCITNAYCKGQMICTCKREYGFLADDNWSCQASSGKASPRIGTSRIGGFYELRRLLPLLVATGLLLTICKRHT
ncbi:hypothetical protein ZHAS_00015715 [Anopheles sinensis]|uniref:Uncharacterized protein n=1 Tax=Anopheles sinensis TaxID=74873 RepID=A0A084WBS6_ANOSI|nr:hypothetical protein ZHAS_00015715 [Anopheles sinensis]